MVFYVAALERRKSVSTTQKPETIARIALTDSAIDQVRQFMVQEQVAIDTAGLRVSATPGGCSGFRYWLNIEEHALPDDHVVEQDGLRIFLDASSARHLSGAEIDFITTVETSGFKIQNPNEPSDCGCDCSEECPA
jgi:iron-sulfur cluster assembly accessory protein